MPLTFNYGNQPFADVICAQRIAYDGSSRAEYIGYAAPGSSDGDAAWMICKLAYDGSGNMVSRKWASGTNHQDKNWNDRTTYTYS